MPSHSIYYNFPHSELLIRSRFEANRSVSQWQHHICTSLPLATLHGQLKMQTFSFIFYFLFSNEQRFLLAHRYTPPCQFGVAELQTSSTEDGFSRHFCLFCRIPSVLAQGRDFSAVGDAGGGLRGDGKCKTITDTLVTRWIHLPGRPLLLCSQVLVPGSLSLLLGTP